MLAFFCVWIWIQEAAKSFDFYLNKYQTHDDDLEIKIEAQTLAYCFSEPEQHYVVISIKQWSQPPIPLSLCQRAMPQRLKMCKLIVHESNSLPQSSTLSWNLAGSFLRK